MFETQKHVDFLKKLTLFIILGIGLCTLFVIIVDPYRIYNFVDKIGFNHVKPTPERFQEQIKLAGAKRRYANALILGNSRAEIGFDPDDKVFAKNAYVSYNLAIPGSGIEVARRQFEHLLSAKVHPKVIILGLDFLDFLEDSNGFDLPKKNASNLIDVSALKWQFDAVFSIQSVADGLRTLRIQHATDAETITSAGFNPLLEYNKYASEQGYYALFRQRAEENAKNYLRKRHYVVSPVLTGQGRWSELKSILAVVRDGAAELHLVIYPYHAQILLMFEQVGLMPAFEQWKMQLAKEIHSIQTQNTESRIQLWDFSGYSDMQCEAIPEKSDTLTKTKWYWEAGHFKAALGSVMLAKMLDKAPNTKNSFGFLLNPTNFLENSQRIQEERRECLRKSPSLLKDVSLLVKMKSSM